MKNILFIILLTLYVVHCYSTRLAYKTYQGDEKVKSFDGRQEPSGAHLRNKRGTRKKSYLLFDNRSGQLVQLNWTDTSRRNGPHEHMTLRPDSGIDVDTYNDHMWEAVKPGTEERLWINGATSYQAGDRKTTLMKRTILVITAPGQPKTEIPEKNVELLVVVDYSTFARHKTVAKATRYMLTILKLVTEVFLHKTLTQHGININVAASKIIVLRRRDPTIKVGTSYGDNSLTYSCDYMEKTAKRLGRTFDHMIFYTRTKFGAGGYARPGTMCTRRACSIIYDHGFTTAFLVAHELAHTLGLDDKPFLGEKSKGYVMAGMVKSHFNNYRWSPYSQAYLLAFLRSFTCLDNTPDVDDNNYPVVHQYPGVHYSLQEQCVLEHGKEYGEWPEENPCQELKCRRLAYRLFYTSNHSPPLEGTKCGEDMWCIRRKCQSRNAPAVTTVAPAAPVHGGWENWARWTRCSMTCDVGVRTRTRLCTNPRPQNGGKTCVGMATEVAKCNTGRRCSNKNRMLEQHCITMGTRKNPQRRWGLDTSLGVNLDCTFESDTCAWINEAGSDQQDWQLNKGETPTSQTGPSADHTKKNAQGQYIYFETSTASSRKGYKARLSSPNVNVPQGCLRFWYNMLGDNKMGTLRVIKTRRGIAREIWSASGNKGSRWIQQELAISGSGSYKITFEADNNIGSWRSDIALDDVTFTSGSCNGANQNVNNAAAVDHCSIKCTTTDQRNKLFLTLPTLDGQSCYNTSATDICYKGECKSVGCDGVVGSGKTTDSCNVCGGDGTSCSQNSGHTPDAGQQCIQAGNKLSANRRSRDINCDFNRNYCSWTKPDRTHEMDWSRKRGSNGYHLDAIVFGREQKKQKAALVSPEVNARYGCLRFRYRMYGRNVYKLRVKREEQGSKQTIWVMKNNQGSAWKNAKININRNCPYKIIIEAVVTRRDDAKISIDDIRFSTRSCSN